MSQAESRRNRGGEEGSELHVGAVGKGTMQGVKKRNPFPCVEQFAGSCSVPGTRGERHSCCLLGWTYIKLVNVNRREIELSFVVTLMNPLPVTVNLFF